MPRIARGLADGCIYHVLNRGNARQQVFQHDDDYAEFVGLLGRGKERFDVRLLSYCLMPNHFHLLLQADSAADLSRVMQWVMTCQVRRYHRKHKSSGHVWQGRFKSFLVQEDIHLLTVARYVEGNPVRAGLVTTAPAWRWSSHGERTSVIEGGLLDDLPIGLPDDWTRFVDLPLTGYERERLHRSLTRQAPYGTLDWVEKVGQMLGLGSRLKGLGRPRKH